MPTAATIAHGTYPIITSGPRLAKGAGFALDTLTLELVDETDSTGGYTAGGKLAGYTGMWVESLESEPESDLLDVVSVRAIGLATAAEKKSRSLGVAGRQIAIGPFEKVVVAWVDDEQGEDPDGGADVEQVKRRVPKLDGDGEVEYKIITTPSGTGDRWNIEDPFLTVTDRYYSAGARPTTNISGTAQTPDNAPTPPPYQWTGYSEPMRLQHPNGWVLADRQATLILGTESDGLWEVEDLYEFRYGAVPD